MKKEQSKTSTGATELKNNTFLELAKALDMPAQNDGTDALGADKLVDSPNSANSGKLGSMAEASNAVSSVTDSAAGAVQKLINKVKAPAADAERKLSATAEAEQPTERVLIGEAGDEAATGDDPFETLTPPPVARTVEPDKALVAAYADRYAKYRALYPAVRNALA